jgi:hypothetical protein
MNTRVSSFEDVDGSEIFAETSTQEHGAPGAVLLTVQGLPSAKAPDSPWFGYEGSPVEVPMFLHPDTAEALGRRLIELAEQARAEQAKCEV